MRVLVTGACGQLGYAVSQKLARRGTEHLGLSALELDVTDQASVQTRLRSYRPDVVINCAAYTKVDQAEEEAGECWAVNVNGVQNLAAGCGEIGAKLIHLSTDYVFSGEGDQPYEPDDCVGPLCVYGRSKLAGELAARTLLKECFIVRTSWAFGKSEANFVKTVLRLACRRTELDVVCDQIGSPTYTVDLASLLCDMAETDRYGVYHATNEGVCSRAEFADEIFRQAGKQIRINAIPTSQYPDRARRPLNSRLGTGKLEEMGFGRLPPWQDALARYLKEINRGSGHKE